jgi:hypothetical protein
VIVRSCAISKPDGYSFDLVEGDLVGGAVVEFGASGGFLGGDYLGVF